ncbi:hypothetical protein [Streptomyces noursei]|uniref:hypothetical protein n=1 Tax=Streptomyces noursei TaxID=1971 RepID=UPI0037F56B10
MTTIRVVQTIGAFGYPEGTVWGPYTHLCDALERIQLLRRYKGDGKMQAGDWEPCGMTRPAVDFEPGEDSEGDT